MQHKSEEPLQVLHNYVQTLGLKITKQRELIAKEFFAQSGHLKAEEILQYVRKIDVKVSLATVYRTLKLLQACGLARSHNFGEGQASFEPITNTTEHHDHLICTKCGKIVEFYNEKIEQLQNDIAKVHFFSVTFHRMELYGICGDCK
ncbi:MAG: transcriptional repressor [bacterium]|nr:transcriptional repressor [bacterium]